MQQLTFFPLTQNSNEKKLSRDAFSHGNVCNDNARIMLEENYEQLLQETSEFNRQLVSFQANKTQVLHSWIKYREGFSANLLDILMEKFKFYPGDIILDPFAGSCTTLLVAEMRSINAVGIELLPHCHLAWEAKSRAFNYGTNELNYVREIVNNNLPPKTTQTFNNYRNCLSSRSRR